MKQHARITIDNPTRPDKLLQRRNCIDIEIQFYITWPSLIFSAINFSTFNTASCTHCSMSNLSSPLPLLVLSYFVHPPPFPCFAFVPYDLTAQSLLLLLHFFPLAPLYVCWKDAERKCGLRYNLYLTTNSFPSPVLTTSPSLLGTRYRVQCTQDTPYLQKGKIAL